MHDDDDDDASSSRGGGGMGDVDSSLSAASVRGPRSAKVGGGKKINLLLVPLFAGWGVGVAVAGGDNSRVGEGTVWFLEGGGSGGGSSGFRYLISPEKGIEKTEK